MYHYPERERQEWDARVNWGYKQTAGYSRWRILAWLKAYWNMAVFRVTNSSASWWWE
jgi:hypothetical protein